MNDNESNSRFTTQRFAPVTTDVEKVSNTKVGKIFKEGAKEATENVAKNVIVPTFKRLVLDSVSNFLNCLLYGDSARPSSGYGPISYGGYYNRSTNPIVYSPYDPRSIQQQPRFQQSTIYAINDYAFKDRGIAETVLWNMQDALNQFGKVAVADFYDLIGQTPNSTDWNYGWYNLDTAKVIQYDNGYRISFPSVTPINTNSISPK